MTLAFEGLLRGDQFRRQSARDAVIRDRADQHLDAAPTLAMPHTLDADHHDGGGAHVLDALVSSRPAGNVAHLRVRGKVEQRASSMTGAPLEATILNRGIERNKLHLRDGGISRSPGLRVRKVNFAEGCQKVIKRSVGAQEVMRRRRDSLKARLDRPRPRADALECEICLIPGHEVEIRMGSRQGDPRPQIFTPHPDLKYTGNRVAFALESKTFGSEHTLANQVEVAIEPVLE